MVRDFILTVVTIKYSIGNRIGKMNRWFIALIIFSLIMVILPVKPPWTITIISRGAPLVIIVVAGHSGCFNIFGVWNNRLLSYPFWMLVCVILGWVCTISKTFFDKILNGHSLCLRKWRLVLILIIYGSRFLPVWINNIAVFTHRLLYKVRIDDELLWWYEIHVTPTKFLDKLCNLLVLLN